MYVNLESKSRKYVCFNAKIDPKDKKLFTVSEIIDRGLLFL